jgi:hypothetical protein
LAYIFPVQQMTSLLSTTKMPASRPSNVTRSPAPAPYRLTVYRIVELLCDPTNRDQLYKDHKTNTRYRVGSMTRLADLSGVAKSAFEHLFRRREEGVWVELNRRTLIRLTAFVNELDPPLVDPLDPERRPIRFDPIEVDGELYAGWERLSHLHAELAPPEETLLPDRLQKKPAASTEAESFLSQFPLSPQERSRVLDFIRQQSSPAQPVQSASQPILERVPSREDAMRLSKLSSLVIQHMDSEQTVSVEDYVAKLLNERGHSTPQEKKTIISGLEDILFKNKLPQKSPLLTLSLLAEFLSTAEGEPFGGDVDSLLAYCDLPTQVRHSNNHA